MTLSDPCVSTTKHIVDILLFSGSHIILDPLEINRGVTDIWGMQVGYRNWKNCQALFPFSPCSTECAKGLLENALKLVDCDVL